MTSSVPFEGLGESDEWARSVDDRVRALEPVLEDLRRQARESGATTLGTGNRLSKVFRLTRSFQGIWQASGDSNGAQVRRNEDLPRPQIRRVLIPTGCARVHVTGSAAINTVSYYLNVYSPDRGANFVTNSNSPRYLYGAGSELIFNGRVMNSDEYWYTVYVPPDEPVTFDSRQYMGAGGGAIIRNITMTVMVEPNRQG